MDRFEEIVQARKPQVYARTGPCRVPSCEEPCDEIHGGRRGLCGTHYRKYLDAVNAGELKWEQIDDRLAGMAEVASRPLLVVGDTRADFFHITCEACTTAVELTDLRWIGGVPAVNVRCQTCDRESRLKLHMPTWVDVFPPPAQP